MRTSFTYAALLAAALLCLYACKSRTVHGPDDHQPQVPAGVRVVMETDTLYFHQSDSVAIRGYATVGDDWGYAMPGVRVNLTLSEHFGYLEYLSRELRDTTNDSGRVDFRFRAAYQFSPASNIIHAYCWFGHPPDGRDTIWVVPNSPRVAHLDVVASKETIYVTRPNEDSLVVTVSIADSGGVGIPNIRLVLQTNGGRFGVFPRTDSAGVSSVWWWTNNDPPGHYFFTVHTGALADTARVLVLNGPTPGS
jgi:hypothetical protein